MNFIRPVFFLFLLSLPLIVFSQSSRVRTFDAQHYIIRSNFDRKNKIYYGDTTVQVKPLNNNFQKLVLDSVGMNFESVTNETDGKTLKYSQTGNSISIELDRAYSKDELVSVRIKYSSSKPKKGIYFVDELISDGRVINPSQVWTQGEAEEVRYWFPSYDFPDDKATTEQFLTVPNNETAISNGQLVEIIQNQNGTKTFHYKMPVVHSLYLTSFVIGKYVKVEDTYKNIPLGYYVYPNREAIARKAYGKTPDMMRVFEQVTGVDFPYNKYDQTEVAQFNFGGMENITATTMADTEIQFGLFSPEGPLDLVSHELAHSWFGNLVTTKDWTNLWLNEGFATFMEAVYRENLNNRNDYLRKIREDAAQYMVEDSFNSNRHPLYRTNPPTDDSLFDTTTYSKGGAVLHTLREEIGNEAFWKGVNIYLNRHKFDVVETNDLKRAMEDASNKDLTWFFDQWVFKAGFPKITIKHRFNPVKKNLTLTVSQTQKSTHNVPAIFNLPLDVEIVTVKGNKTETIKLEKRSQVFNISVPSKPTKILIDQYDKIPIKQVKILK